MSAPPVADLLAAVRGRRVFDLATGWWRGMPQLDLHPRFDVIAYRTPAGVQIDGDVPRVAPEVNTAGYGFITELVMGTMHIGTHIDALAHVTGGSDQSWYGGFHPAEHLGDFGPKELDASRLPNIVSRAVLFDIPAARGIEHLPPHEPIGPDDLEDALARSELSIGDGDVALIRTGRMTWWPDETQMERRAGGAGLSLAGARWLTERGVRAIGADTPCVEVEPSGIAGNPRPVHLHVIRECGVPLLEWVVLDELSQAGVGEMLFVCLPLTITGATGSLVRPIAIV